MKIQAALLDLERRVSALTGYPTIPGTTLQRVQADRATLERAGIEVPPGEEAMFVWCLALGPAHAPKSFYLGATVIGAIRKAQTDVVAWEEGERVLAAKRHAAAREKKAVHVWEALRA